MPIMYIRIFQFTKYKSQLNVIYKWTQCCHLAPEYGFCAAALFSLCACHYSKHTLQLNYHFQVDASQCCSYVSHLQFKLEALLKCEVYYLHPKHSFHVIQPGLSIRFPFAWPHMYWEPRNGHIKQIQYIQQLTTWGRQISNSH